MAAVWRSDVIECRRRMYIYEGPFAVCVLCVWWLVVVVCVDWRIIWRKRTQLIKYWVTESLLLRSGAQLFI